MILSLVSQCAATNGSKATAIAVALEIVVKKIAAILPDRIAFWSFSIAAITLRCLGEIVRIRKLVFRIDELRHEVTRSASTHLGCLPK
jgi:Mg2+/Co2+ transporter CorB